MSSNEPVRNGCEVIHEIFHSLNCGFKVIYNWMSSAYRWYDNP